MNSLEVIILCGGKVKLRPITENIPKPMVEIKKANSLIYLIIYQIMESKIFILHLGISLKSFIATLMITKNLKINTVDSGDADIIQRIKIVEKI